ncbi:hypothetical protein ZIOFF_065973 [Zingiber officinale]|uniref:Piwi domain-containing protein n=1 Tax=Zingiber officinale TaxID=94328 RepID=A0A8J5EXQ2_ZINOF|nr:hypothetical protein ZIOFF_065973 [Zingiber officinale]
MCQISGMEFSLDHVLHPLSARPDHVERALLACYHDAMSILQPQGKELDLLIVILSDNDGSLYGDLKRICETGLGLVGGRDTILVDALSRCISLVSDRPTIIFGADITHPHPWEDSSPSIAAKSKFSYHLHYDSCFSIFVLNTPFVFQACASLEPNYQPPVNFVVVQKCHHTRLFANNHGDHQSIDKSGNILPG